MVKSVLVFILCAIAARVRGEYYLGCFTDAGHDRIMQDPVVTASNTHSSCHLRCWEMKKLYFGVQNGQDCWCANDPSGFARHGNSQNCNVPCTGDSSTICGGIWAMAIFRTSYAPIHHLGCYADSDDRIMQDPEITQSNSIGYCHSRCVAMKKRYFGVQNGQDCWCANDPTRIARHGISHGCNVPCTGDNSNNCGGMWAMDVYMTNVEPEYYLGCFKDGSVRIMQHGEVTASNSVSYCHARCVQLKKMYLGVQNGQDCWCSDNPTDFGRMGLATNCDKPCTGDSSITCGGHEAMAIYRTIVPPGYQ